MRRLRDERGMALVLALGILVGEPGELIVKLGDLIFDVGKIWIAYALLAGQIQTAARAGHKLNVAV